MAKNVTYNSTLVGREDIADGLCVFRFKPDCELPAAPWFTAGQYMLIGLNNEQDSQLGAVQRPMSIASPPEERDMIEFYIRYVDKPTSKNPLTHLLWKLQEGDRAYLRPVPKGKFTVDDIVAPKDSRKKVMVAAGTGLAPFLSIVHSELRNGRNDLSGFAILHGASYDNYLGYRTELERLSEKHGLCYLPTISRPQQCPDWKGHVGRVEDIFCTSSLPILEEGLGLATGGFTSENALVLLCGLQGTIGKSIERLAARGFAPEHASIRRALEIPEGVEPSLFFEQYDSTPVLDLKDEALVARVSSQLRAALQW